MLLFFACNVIIDIARNTRLYVTKTSKRKTLEDAVFAQDHLLMKDQRKWRGARGDDWHPHTGSLCSNLRQPQPPCSAVKRINCRDRTWLFANRHVNYYRGRHFVQTMATLWVFCFLCLQNMPVPSACIVYQTRIHTRLESSSTKKLIFLFCFLAQHYPLVCTNSYDCLWVKLVTDDEDEKNDNGPNSYESFPAFQNEVRWASCLWSRMAKIELHKS